MVFFRAADTTFKRSLKFTLKGEDSGIELMAEGQQVVVAAHHKSGAEVITTLADYPFADLPVLDGAAIDDLWLEIAELVEAAGRHHLREPGGPGQSKRAARAVRRGGRGARGTHAATGCVAR